MPLNLIIRIKLMMNKKIKLNNYQKKINFYRRKWIIQTNLKKTSYFTIDQIICNQRMIGFNNKYIIYKKKKNKYNHRRSS